MDPRETSKRVGTKVSKAIENAGANPAAIAEAIGLDQHEMNDRLAGVGDFSVSQLIETGGLLRVRASQFVAGVA